MSTQRLSLNSPVFSGRVKKYDTYQPYARSARRMLQNENSVQSHKTTQKLYSSIKKVDGWAEYRPQKELPKQFTTGKSVNKIASQRVVQQKRTTHNSTQHLALQTVKTSKSEYRNIEEQFTQVVAPVKRSLTKWQKVFYSAGVAVFMLATVASIQTFITNKHAQDQLGLLGVQTSLDEQGVSEGTGKEPSEGEVSDNAIAAYQVSPELPRYLRIPQLGVFARIKHTGVDKDGSVDAPKNINDVSWYTGSAKLGNAIGSSLLLGHVSGWTAPGVFKNISKLHAGDRFEVEKGNGEKLVYEVTRGESIPVESLNMSKVLASESGQHELKLMTCSGKYNRETGHYEERYVVYAKIVR
ncbi:class F sortase [Candidatus Saccharibacteria bacterium]|nr:class F sortase [Candidatus Saccharibacteria bacterium]